MTEGHPPDRHEQRAYGAFGKSRQPVAKPRKQEEGGIVNVCMRWCFENGIDCWRQNSGAYEKTYFRKFDQREVKTTIRYGRKGAADIHGIIPLDINGQRLGRHLSIECKTATGDQRDAQIKEQERVEKHGGIYVLARTRDELEAAKDHILGILGRGT